MAKVTNSLFAKNQHFPLIRHVRTLTFTELHPITLRREVAPGSNKSISKILLSKLLNVNEKMKRRSEALTSLNRGFASDNYAGIHPAVLDALNSVNTAHAVAYGEDQTTASLALIVKEQFGEDAEVFPVFNGTGANVIALSASINRWESVICADTAHIHVDEGGAPEAMAGIKLWTVATPDGKLTPELISTQLFDIGSVHRAQPGIVSITQATELGTLYTLDEISAIAKLAHDNNLLLHMDGARLSNGVEALTRDLGRYVSFHEMTTGSGVDILSFGGTKIGAMGAEAIITLTDSNELQEAVKYLRKTSMQLASKMRFVSAQLIALLENGAQVARTNASHANAMAQALEMGVREIAKRNPRVVLTNHAQANSVFPILPQHVIKALSKDFRFYTWNADLGLVRWMCSWDTTQEDVDKILEALATALK
jgi:threonine aldolase